MRAFLLIGLCGCGVLRSPSGPASTAPVLVELERGECLGECPVYRVIVYADGVVEYHGERNVDVVSVRTARIGAEHVEILRDALARIDVAHLPDYPNPDCTDMPEVDLTVRGRRLRHDHGDRKAPEDLFSLEDLIDDVAQTRRWVGDEHAMAQPLGSYCY